MTVAPETDVYYDPYDTGINTDPYPTFARLREESPIYYNEQYDFWAISRHSDVEQALANWQTFSSRRSDILELVKSEFDMPGGVMMFQDPPEHSMLRGLMSRVFTPRRMAEIEDQIRAILRGVSGSVRRVGRIRHHLRARVDDADAGDRHAAGNPGVRTDLGSRR